MKIQRHKGIAAMVGTILDHSVLVCTLTFVMAAFGIFGLVKMNKDEFPSLTIKQGLVVGVYPGASAEEVENRLAKPLEDVLLGYAEVDRESLRSISNDGMCFVFADLDCSPSEKDEIWGRIKDGMNAAKPSLPAGVLAVVVKDDFNALSSLLIALESEDKGYAELKDYADSLCTELRRIPNLASVSILGDQTEEIAVTIDREKMSAYALDPTSLMLGYQTSTLPLPAGTFSNDDVNARIHVRSDVAGEREVAEKIVYSDPAGNIIRLKDIATIERRYRDPSEMVTYNGHSCLILSVEMRDGNDIVAFGREVDKVLGRFEKSMPESVTMSRITDQPKVVSNSVTSFLRDLGLSMLVVVLVMLLLFPIKSALIAGSGVPVCTLIAIAIMYLTRIQLHIVTLASLIVVLGMIVDNAIITIDGYMEKLGKGMSRRDAAAMSLKELFVPTLASTLSICAMYYSVLFFIDGYLGEFVRMFPFVISIALLVSLCYAVTVVPILEVKYIHSAKTTDNGLTARMQNWLFDTIDNSYRKMESWCFAHPGMTLGGGALTIALGILMFSSLNVQMMPKSARDFFAIELEMEGGCGFEDTKAVCDSLEAILGKDKDVKSVTSFIGCGAPRFSSTYAPILPGERMAQIIVNTTSSAATESILKHCENNYEHLFPNAIIRFKQMDYQDVEAPLMITLKGADRMAMKPAADSITAFIRTLDKDVKWVHNSSGFTEPSVEISLDPDEAGRLGVNKSLLALNLAGTYNGLNIATVWEGDDAISVNLYSEGTGGNAGFDNIGSQMVSTGIPGVSVPLRQVAQVEPSWAPASLERRSGEQSITVFADMKYGKSQPAAVKTIRKYIKDNIEPVLPEGCTVEYLGLTKTNADLLPQVVMTVVLALIVLFVFMALHFGKQSLAFITLVLSSLCFFGAFFGLWIFRLDFGLTGVLGVISLIGIIVRNGIIMFDYAEQLRKEGATVREAAMQAGARRMKPIFLTSSTTALGVIPMVVGGDLLWQPMGVVICFGTILSLLLIVLVMPVAYWQIFRNEDSKKAIDKE